MRVKAFDPDYRRVAKVNPCISCGRPMKSHREPRFMAWYIGPWIVHPDDADDVAASYIDEHGVDVTDSVASMSLLSGPIGLTCAKKIGKDWLSWVWWGSRRRWQ